jgi:hypothetical protein
MHAEHVSLYSLVNLIFNHWVFYMLAYTGWKESVHVRTIIFDIPHSYCNIHKLSDSVVCHGQPTQRKVLLHIFFILITCTERQDTICVH